MYNLGRLFLIPFYEVYLSDYLTSYYGTFIPMGSKQTFEAIKDFIVILRLWMLMNCEILAKTCNFLLPQQRILATSVSKLNLLFKLILNSLLSLLFLMTSLFILIEKDSSVLKMRWQLSTIAIQKVFSPLSLVFLEKSQNFQNRRAGYYHLRNS